jgi:tetratricopeptide (TPR) repeat protein
MVEAEVYNDLAGDVEAALLDAELFLKYHATEKAIGRLQRAVSHNPRAIQLHEKLRELMVWQKRPVEAAKHCLVLATLYIERENFDDARERLLEAKQLDARISVAPGLEAIRRGRYPQLLEQPQNQHAAAPAPASGLLSGRLGSISIFDIIQLLESGRLTGSLALSSGATEGRVFFNNGNIIGADVAGIQGEHAFRQLIQVVNGSFGFDSSGEEFPITITAPSNTNLMLETLRVLDEEKSQPALIAA